MIIINIHVNMIKDTFSFSHRPAGVISRSSGIIIWIEIQVLNEPRIGLK